MTEPIKWNNAPDRTSWGASMRVADIEIDRDHTLTLFCETSQTAKVDAMFAEVERLRAVAAQALAFTLRGFSTVRDFDAARAVMHDALRAALKETK